MEELQFKYSNSDFILRTPSWQNPSTKSKFDSVLMGRWDNAVTNGCFRYTLDDLQTKLIPGPMKYIAQLNLKRASDRRKPQEMLSLSQPFNPNKFNFTKINDKEILIELCPDSSIKNKDKGGTIVAKDCITNNGCADPNTDVTEEKKEGNGALEGAAKRQKTTNSKHVVIINVSPLEYCNILLVPNIQDCLPQMFTQEGIQVALEMLLLSSKRSFRVCGNSLGAFASVNHLHFHAYHLNYELKIETVPTKLVHGPCHELLDWPARGFIFQLDEATNVQKLARYIYTVANHLHSNEIAHNIFLTRGASLGSEADGLQGDTQETVRAIIWPRKSCFGAKTDEVFNVAVCELAGHLPIYSREGYANLTEEWTIGHVNEVSLSQQAFNTLKEDIKKLQF
ncbi:GDP-D-glucose phosphorylase 1-like [Amphiura filiformis]|uniref:GDP-D-glucose phosphorylase 1-like n=1 Tax=Amphiura filiformis TaxID=82378 RepID=UPI003B21D847